MARARIKADEIPAKLAQLQRALERVKDVSKHVGLATLETGKQTVLLRDVRATIDDVFGESSTEAGHDFRVTSLWFSPKGSQSLNTAHRYGINRVIETIEAASRRLSDKLDDAAASNPDKTLQAYQGMNLHPVIADAASALYADGHYKNAVLDSVIALNNLVRSKSFITDRDGAALMEFVFSPRNPILQFNPLETDSDREEQKGYMNLFCGAVSGLRNPRAHGLVIDDAERALEFIAFVSLLAKLVEGTLFNRREEA